MSIFPYCFYNFLICLDLRILQMPHLLTYWLSLHKHSPPIHVAFTFSHSICNEQESQRFLSEEETAIIIYMPTANGHFHAFLEFFLSVVCKILFSNQWLLSQIFIVETIDSSERGLNPVAMTIFDFWRLKRRPAVLKSFKLPTEVRRLDLLAYNVNVKYK